MAMAQANPAVLTHATRLRPRSLHQSRSPSRSPGRPLPLAAQDLDPLLSNLSPESTLRALQATDTLSNDQRIPDVLRRSIADASTFERELGVRAAYAAQKTQEWLKEVSAWSWPNRKEWPFGVGFLSPQSTTDKRDGPQEQYWGSLPAWKVQRYEGRVSDIKASLNALEIDEVKDYVLDAHAISQWMSDPHQQATQQDALSYARMRDFTALITATVIRALPDLSELNGLLNIWTVRLAILRQIPNFVIGLENSHIAVREASGLLKLEKWAATLNRVKFEHTKSDLSGIVSALGAAVDKMLDLLEGHEDRLPQSWIDTLESVELGFATWVVEAQRRVQHNELLPRPISRYHAFDRTGIDSPPAREDFPTNQVPRADLSNKRLSTVGHPPNPDLSIGSLGQDTRGLEDQDEDATPLASKADNKFVFPQSTNAIDRRGSERDRNLSLDVPKGGHKREVSEVSVADSNYSAFSSISEAEIIDATSETLASPKVSVVQNHFRAGSEDLSGMLRSSQPRVQSMYLATTSPQDGDKQATSHTRSRSMGPFMFPQGSENLATDLPGMSINSSSEVETTELDMARPPLLQRASTASMELIPSAQVKRVTMRRSASQDLASLVIPTADGTPSGALRQLTEEVPNDTNTKDVHGPDPVPLPLGPPSNSDQYLVSPIDDSSPFSMRTRVSDLASRDSPELPRRSSKRSRMTESPITPTGPDDLDHDHWPSGDTDLKGKSRALEAKHAGSPKKAKLPEESLEAKIQDILTTLPTAIRLNSEPESENASQTSTAMSTRSSSPAPALVLSPVKKDKLTRQNTSDVRVFHLTRSGQPRDAPPTKLFVRLVGERGERVMVRVGGGWADLGEYLREYSLHHGKRGIADGRLEVASFPANGPSPKEITTSPMIAESLLKTPTSTGILRTKSRPQNSPDTAFDWAALPDVDVRKTRGSILTPTRVESPNPMVDETRHNSISQAIPSIPPVPQGYTIQSPTMVSTTGPSGKSVTLISHDSPTSSSHFRTTSGTHRSTNISSTTTSPIVSTSTTTVYSPVSSSSAKYTPLGAAGPKSSAKRATTFGSVTPAENDAWVEGMVGKARAVSGGNSPIVTTQTVNTPGSRRVSSNMLGDSPGSSSGRESPSPAAARSGRDSPGAGRPKSRMSSLGDVSGIKRVFLRRRTEK